MITIKSNIDVPVELQFKGEFFTVEPKKATKYSKEQAEFILKTLDYCEVVKDEEDKQGVKKESAVPPAPKKKEDK